MEVGAVVGDREFQITHAKSVTSLRSPAADHVVPLLWGGARKTAAGFDRHAALAAKRAILGFVACNWQFDQSVGLYRKFDFTTAAVNQGARGHHASSRLFHHVHRFLRRAARSPYVLDYEHMLVRVKSKAAPKRHGSAGVAFHKERRHTAPDGVLRRRQSPRDLVPDDEPPESGRNHGVDPRVRKQGREGL